MIVDEAIDRGDKKKLLEFNIYEKPVALQLGGSNPKLLSKVAKIGWYQWPWYTKCSTSVMIIYPK